MRFDLFGKPCSRRMISAPIVTAPMEINGRPDRRRERRTAIWIGGVFGGYLLLCFLAPAMLPTGSVPELSGRANSIDYFSHDSWGNHNWSEDSELGHNQSAHGGTFAWSEMNPIWAFTYGFGDINCHQKHSRSWIINENQMPVCVRDIGIFAGAALGAALFGRFGVNRWTIRDTLLSILPDNALTGIYQSNRRMHAFLGIGILCAVPMGIDGFTQMLSSYESNPTMRLITGMPFGIFIGSFLASSFAARPEYFGRDPSNVVLPSGSRFSLAKDSEE